MTDDVFDRMASEIAEADRDPSHPDHVHVCVAIVSGDSGQCGPDGMGPCTCTCGATVEHRDDAPDPAAPNWWLLADGTWSKFPDPREKWRLGIEE
jgi:hypothetical protein